MKGKRPTSRAKNAREMGYPAGNDRLNIKVKNRGRDAPLRLALGVDQVDQEESGGGDNRGGGNCEDPGPDDASGDAPANGGQAVDGADADDGAGDGVSGADRDSG